MTGGQVWEIGDSGYARETAERRGNRNLTQVSGFPSVYTKIGCGAARLLEVMHEERERALFRSDLPDLSHEMMVEGLRSG